MNRVVVASVDARLTAAAARRPGVSQLEQERRRPGVPQLEQVEQEPAGEATAERMETSKLASSERLGA